jgi:hypothetical protein
MTLQCVFPMSVFGGADAETFSVNLTTDQAECLMNNLDEALQQIYYIEDFSPPPLNLFKLSINSNN